MCKLIYSTFIRNIKYVHRQDTKTICNEQNVQNLLIEKQTKLTLKLGPLNIPFIFTDISSVAMSTPPQQSSFRLVSLR